MKGSSFLRWCRTLGLGAILVLAACSHRANTAPVRAPSSLEVALERLEMYGFSGTVLVEIDGRPIVARGFGMANNALGTRNTLNTAYDVGSITKTLTAAAVLVLMDDGQLRLTDSLAGLFPGMRVAVSGITIHHLLTHTSGLPLDPSHAGIDSSDAPALFIEKALAFDGRARIGRYDYSNLGYGLLALIVERVSGQEFRSFVNDRLLRRAGMTRTTWWSEHDAMARSDAAGGYVFNDREEVLLPEPRFARGSASSPVWSKWPIGAGGVISTAPELLRWWHALQENHVLSPASTHAMLTLQDSAARQGYGWNIVPHAALGQRIYRGGSRTGFNSMLAAYPERNAVVVFAINQSGEAGWAGFVWRTIERHLLGQSDSLPPAAVALDREQLGAFTGIYRLPDGGLVRVLVESGELVVGALNQGGTNALGCVVPDSSAISSSAATARVIGATQRSTSDTALVNAVQRAQLRRWIATNWLGAAEVDILGTAPHPSAASRVQTFARATGHSGVLRLIWEGEQLLGWSDGVRMPCFARFRPTSDTSAVSFNPRAAGWATLHTREHDGVGGMVFVPRNGRMSARAIRASAGD